MPKVLHTVVGDAAFEEVKVIEQEALGVSRGVETPIGHPSFLQPMRKLSGVVPARLRVEARTGDDVRHLIVRLMAWVENQLGGVQWRQRAALTGELGTLEILRRILQRETVRIFLCTGFWV